MHEGFSRKWLKLKAGVLFVGDKLSNRENHKNQNIE